MSRTALDRAERLFAAGRNGEVIALLEPQVPVYRESSRFYYVLGSACLRSGDSGGASAYLKRAQQLDPTDLDVLLALAALDVRKGETDKAVASYLRVLEDRPQDRRARRALEILRTEGSPERLAALVNSGKIARLYPGPAPAGGMTRRAAAALAIAAAALALAYGAYRLAGSLASGRKPRPEVAAVSLNEYEKASPVATGGSFKYVLTEAQAIAAFERAKDFFQEYRDNAALVEINRLEHSNASTAIKRKAGSLKAFVGAPDFRTVRDAPSFSALVKDQSLYDGCSVAWKGMAANVREQGGGSAFDFLVGYEEKQRLEGIIPASIASGPVPLDRPLEILAIIRSAEGKPRLECVAIHELVGAKP